MDRPVSVVKELTENAIDAGATAITVEIKQGGTTLIRVTDNGGGIAAEDLPAAFQRHSTSKITEAADLLTVSSLGFRGEALSSVAAVARVELITRTHSSLVGNRYVIEGGQQLALEEVGAPEGTTIIVRDLFYNTPARRKFLKTPATEGGYIYDMIGKMALSRPDISFRYIQNGQNRLHTSGNHNLKDVIYHVYGRELTRELIPLSFESSFFSLEGFIGKPVIARSSRSCEIYFINGRYIRSQLINRAIEEGYRNFLMQHKFPFTVFNIKIEPEFTDVNVHPSKMELRFRNQEFLFEEVVRAIRKTLTAGELSPSFSVETAKSQKAKETMKNVEKAAERKGGVSEQKKHNPDQAAEKIPARPNPSVIAEQAEKNAETVKSSTGAIKGSEETVKSSAGAVKDSAEIVKNTPETVKNKKQEKLPEPFEVKRMEQLLIREKEAAYKEKETPAESKPVFEGKTSPESKNVFEGKTSLESKNTFEGKTTFEEKSVAEEIQAVDVQQQNLFEEKLLTMDTVSQVKLAGQIFDTYWIVQYQEYFMIIDQHAAHEKVLYESIIKQLKNQEYTTQQMNPPAIITLTPRQQGQFEALSDLLVQLGFEIEPFGGNEYAVYGMPDNLVGIKPMDFLEEILEHAGDKGRITPEAVYEKAASLACKAAIKGKQKLSDVEAEQLIADLVKLENPYTCPHGRPTMIKMTRYELEKKFKRVL